MTDYKLEISLEDYCRAAHPDPFHCFVLDALVPLVFCRSYCKVPAGDYSLLAELAESPSYRGAALDWYWPGHRTLRTMAASFAAAMARWTKSGFPTVSQDEYIRRRAICSECAGKAWRCPFCGCVLWLKAALPKSVLAHEFCPMWETDDETETSNPTSA